MTKLVELVAEEIDALADVLGGRLKAVEAELTDVRSRRGRLYEALETTDLTMQALSRRVLKLRQLEDPLAAAQEDAARQLQQRKAKLPMTEEMSGYVADLRDFPAVGSIPERKAPIRNLVESVEVSDDGAVVTRTIPVLPDGVSKERTRALHLVQPNPPFRTCARRMACCSVMEESAYRGAFLTDSPGPAHRDQLTGTRRNGSTSRSSGPGQPTCEECRLSDPGNPGRHGLSRSPAVSMSAVVHGSPSEGCTRSCPSWKLDALRSGLSAFERPVGASRPRRRPKWPPD